MNRMSANVVSLTLTSLSICTHLFVENHSIAHHDRKL